MTSKSIYDDGTLSEFMTRVENLKADAVRQWGTMNVSQMLAHCSAVFEAALGDKPLKRSFIGLVFGRMAKPMLTNDKPFKQNIPTDKGFIVTDKCFQTPKEFSNFISQDVEELFSRSPEYVNIITRFTTETLAKINRLLISNIHQV